jgi:hypothetical protein
MKFIGYWPAAIAGVVLAISPEMVGLSRIVGSPMMALVLTLLALGFWLHGKPILAGICLGLGLMSGTGFWMGVVIIGISYALSDRLFTVSEVFTPPDVDGEKPDLVRFGLSFGATLLVVGTGFFMAPAGLTGIFSGLFDFVSGFRQARLAPWGLIPLALLTYSTGALIFGVWGGIRGVLYRSKLDMFLFIWVGLGLALILLYPASNSADLIWVTFPLWILAARVVTFTWRNPETSRLVVAVTTVMVVVVFAFMLLALRTLVTPTLPRSQQINYLIALAGGVVLLVAIYLLVSYGWSEDNGRAGLLLGLALVFTAGMIAMSVNSTGIGPKIPYTLWYPDEPFLVTKWLGVTIDRTLVWNARGSEPVDVAVAGIESPGLRWALRAYDPVYFVPYVPPQSQPGMVITSLEGSPELSGSYQGTSLVWARQAPWDELTADQYLTWLVTREVPTVPDELIVWVRTDLMPGGQFDE